jgi:anionic cell wall polymer biosynthesis LytR-Cps2A-Psr (LCP) family protein
MKKTGSKKKVNIALLFVLCIVLVAIVLGLSFFLELGIFNSGSYDAEVAEILENVDTTQEDSLSELARINETLQNADKQENDKQFYGGSRINILITGVDSRIGTRYRHADANHVLSINFATKTIDIVSIPRDTPIGVWHLDTVRVDSNGKRRGKLTGEEAALALANNGRIINGNADDSAGNEIYNETYDIAPTAKSPKSTHIRIDTVYTKITECRPIYGRERYIEEIERIGGFEKIHYWMEFGFSQAQGLMEFMGHEDPKTSLQVLRSRKSMNTGDYQRCYNQAQFIRQMIIKYFDNLDGVSGSLILRGSLALVETNISYSQARGIYDKMVASNMGISPSSIKVTVKPTAITKFQYIDFTKTSTMDSLRRLVNRYAENSETENANNTSDVVERRVISVLQNAIQKAVRDSARNAQYVINDLSIIYEQHAWLQISNLEKRDQYRSQIVDLLINAYNKKGKTRKVEEINYVIQAEKALLDNKKELNQQAKVE